MALFSRVHTWVSNEVLTASDLNNEFNNLISNAITTSIVGYSANVSQMQTIADPGSVGSESLAGSAADEITRLRYMLKFLSGKGQWYDHTGRSFAAGALAAQTADIVDGAITTPKIADANITAAKMAVRNYVSSAALSSSLVTSGTYVDLGSLSVTTFGNPVFVAIGQPTPGSGLASMIQVTNNNANGGAYAQIRIVRIDSLSVQTTVYEAKFGGISYKEPTSVTVSPATVNTPSGAQSTSATLGSESDFAQFSYPGSSINCWDNPAAGTYTYKIQSHIVTTGAGINVFGSCLQVRELV